MKSLFKYGYWFGPVVEITGDNWGDLVVQLSEAENGYYWIGYVTHPAQLMELAKKWRALVGPFAVYQRYYPTE